MTVQSVMSPSSNIIGPEQLATASLATGNANSTKGILYTFKAQQTGSIKSVGFWCSALDAGVIPGVEILSAKQPSGYVSGSSYLPAADVVNDSVLGYPGADATDVYEYCDEGDGDADKGDYALMYGDHRFILQTSGLAVAATDRIRSVQIFTAATAAAASGGCDVVVYQDSTVYTVDTITTPLESLPPIVFQTDVYQSPRDNVPWTETTIEELDDANYGWGWDSDSYGPGGWGQKIYDNWAKVTYYTTDNRLASDYDGQVNDAGPVWVKATFDTAAAVTSGTEYYLHLWAVNGSSKTFQVPVFTVTGNSWFGAVDETTVDASGIASAVTEVSTSAAIPMITYYADITPTSAWTAAASKATLNATSHPLVVGQIVTVSGVTPSDYNGTWEVESITANTAVMDIGASPANSSVDGLVTPIGPESFPCAEYEGATVDTDNSVDMELTTAASSDVSLVTFYAKSIDAAGPNASMTVDVRTAADGGGSSRGSGTVKTTEVSLSTSAWTKVQVPITPYTTSAEETFVYFTSPATAGRGWNIYSVDLRSDALATTAPTLAEIEKAGWTGTRADGGNDSVDGADRYDHGCQIVVAPTFYHPYEAFLRGLSSTQGLWFLDETTGTVCTDYSGNDNHGVYTSGGSGPTLGVDGPLSAVVRPSRAIEFSGADNERSVISDAASLRPGTSDFSFAFWMRKSVHAGYEYFFGNGASAGDYAIGKYPTGTASETCFVRIDNSVFDFPVMTGAAVWLGAYTRVVINCDRDASAEIFFDGVSVDTVDISAKSATSLGASGDFTIGTRPDLFGTPIGSMADFQLRFDLWTADEIAEDYAYLSDLGLVTPTSATTVSRP